MSVAPRIPLRAIDDMLDALFAVDVDITGATEMDLYVPSLRGFVTNEAELVGAVGADQGFVTTAGAALAAMPLAESGAEDPERNEDVVASYSEVANVLSRLVNDFGDEPVHIDPNAQHSTDDLGLIVGAAERCLFTLTIDGYGHGVAGIWTCL